MRIDIKGVIVPNDDKWIYEWFEMDSVCPKDVLDKLDQAEGKPVDIYINSGGGDVFAGAEIYAALREYKGAVIIHVVGLAGSAASVIMCAGKSDITPVGMVMIHNVSLYGVDGDYHEMDSASEMLKQANDSVALAYQLKTGKTRAEILKAMDRETWMSSDEAVNFGIVDSIVTGAGRAQLAAAGSSLIPKAMIEKVRALLPEQKNVNDPAKRSDFYMREKLQAQINLLKIGGIKE